MPSLLIELRTAFGAFIRDAELPYDEGQVPAEMCAMGERVFKRAYGGHVNGPRVVYVEYPLRQVRVK